VFWNEEEELITDEWVGLLQRQQHKNQSCDPTTITVTREASFTHSVAINWGGEITASAEGAAKLWFWKVQAEVGAKVFWNRTGEDTEVEKFSIEHTKDLGPCKYIEFFYNVRKVHKKYTAHFARAEFRCRDHHTGLMGPWHLCDFRPVSAEGQGYISQSMGWENETKICDCGTDGIAFNHVDFNADGQPIVNGGGSTGNGSGYQN
jgi:hypothetical protein